MADPSRVQAGTVQPRAEETILSHRHYCLTDSETILSHRHWQADYAKKSVVELSDSVQVPPSAGWGWMTRAESGRRQRVSSGGRTSRLSGSYEPNITLNLAPLSLRRHRRRSHRLHQRRLLQHRSLVC